MKRNTGSFFQGFALSAFSGGLWLAAYTVPWAGPLMWLALAPAFVALGMAKKYSHALLYMLVTIEIGVGGYMAHLAFQAWMVPLVLALPVPLALLASLVWKFTRRNFTLTVFALAALASCIDLVVSFTPGTGVASPAITQADFPIGLATAFFGGYSLVTFFIILINGLLAGFFLLSSRNESRSAVFIVRAIFFFSLLFTISILSIPSIINVSSFSYKVAALEGGATSPKGRKTLGHYIKLTREAAEQGAKLIVWPEKFLEDDPLSDDALKNEFESLAKETGAFIVLSFQSGNRCLAAPVSPEKGFLEPYAKHYPAFVLGEKAVPGTEEPVYETEWGAFGVMVCFDMHYEDVARKLAHKGAGVIAVSTNSNNRTNALFWTRRAASLRAVENGVTIIVSDAAGGTCIALPDGSLTDIYQNQSGILTAHVDIGPGRTFYNQRGHLLRWLFPLILLAITGISVYHKRHERNQ